MNVAEGPGLGSCGVFDKQPYEGKYLNKVWGLENHTNLNSIFCLIKSSEIVFIFLLAILKI